MARLWSLVPLSFAMAIVGVATASAQTVERSGGSYHVSACAGPVAAPGTARCHAHIVTDARGNHLTNRYAPNRTERNVRASLVPAGYGPGALQSAYYGLSAAVAVGNPRTVIAVVDAYGYNNAAGDLAVYRATFGLPALPPCPSAIGPCFAKVNESGIQGRYPRQDTGWAQESALDIEMVSAMCPRCTIVLVEANSDSLQDLATAVNTAAALGAHVITNSYGGSEGGTSMLEPAYNHLGVAITASSGDSGYAAGPQFPATSPHVTAVGGTSLAPANTARGWGETAWSGAGSGCSQVYAKPSWQSDPLCKMRMEADVSAVADPDTGVAVYGPVNGNMSGWQVFGGTSVSAQIIGGVYGANGGAVIYGSGPYHDASALNPVTSGSNGSCGGTYFCIAGPGYDGPTGLGTPKGVAAF